MEEPEVLDVKSLLLVANKEEDTTIVKQPSTVEVDVGNLLGFCYQEMPLNTSIQEWTRESLQVLVGHLFNLPVDKSPQGPLAKLPEPTTIIPREKPYPKERVDTKWEKFRKGKGISKRRKNTQVWDKDVKDWRYQFGHKRKNDDRNDWVLEDKPSQLKLYGAEDPFMLTKMKKKEVVDKQKIREKNNLLRTSRIQDRRSLPGVIGLSNKGRHEYSDIKRAIKLAQKSTGSIGYFDNKMSDEPQIKRKPKYVTGEDEQKTNRKIVNSIIKKKNKGTNINIRKAVNQSIAEEQRNNKRRRTK